MLDPFTKAERIALVGLASLLTTRMLGLFMILPVLSIYVAQFPTATPFFIGLSIGIYGLTQACCQIPLGYLSDKFGRKPLIAIGLGFLALGSLVAALSDSLATLIIGRALQGAGAVGSLIMAYAADLTRPTQRTKAMAILGSFIGLSFALAIVFGSTMTQWLGARSIFWLTLLLSFCCFIILYFLRAQPYEKISTPAFSLQLLGQVLSLPLCILYSGVFILHGILSSVFVLLPAQLVPLLQSQGMNTSLFYLLTLSIAFTCTALLIMRTRKTKHSQTLQHFSILLLVLSLVGFALHIDLFDYCFNMIGFFIGFAYLEADQPASITREVSNDLRGTALGFYATAQFLGIFIGGATAGFLANYLDFSQIFLCYALFCLVWLATTWSLRKYSSYAVFTCNSHSSYHSTSEKQGDTTWRVE